MQPHRIWFLRRFALKTGTDFDHSGLESGMVFEGTTSVYERICRLNSKWIRKKEYYANSFDWARLKIACVASVSVRFRSKERGTRVKKWGGGGEERKFPSFPSPFPSFILALFSFLARPKPRIPLLGLSLLRNQTETLATQASLKMMT